MSIPARAGSLERPDGRSPTRGSAALAHDSSSPILTAFCSRDASATALATRRELTHSLDGQQRLSQRMQSYPRRSTKVRIACMGSETDAVPQENPNVDLSQRYLS